MTTLAVRLLSPSAAERTLDDDACYNTRVPSSLEKCLQFILEQYFYYCTIPLGTVIFKKSILSCTIRKLPFAVRNNGMCTIPTPFLDQ